MLGLLNCAKITSDARYIFPEIDTSFGTRNK